MRSETLSWTPGKGWNAPPALRDAQLVMVFGSREALEEGAWATPIAQAYPSAKTVGASSSGEILGQRLLTEGVVVAALRFEHSTIKVASISLDAANGSEAAGAHVAAALQGDDLAHVLILADGTRVNGTELVRGALNELPRTVGLTGGLAGDGDKFERTVVVEDGKARPGHVVAVGLYGSRLRIGFGSMGGWDRHGNQRILTRAVGNKLYEIDGRRALDVYKEALGDRAKDLPSSGLLFPLLVHLPEGDVVRTLLGIDEKEGSLTLAGDVPAGRPAYFMKANFSRLIEGARGAAIDARTGTNETSERFALLVSCVGRRLVLGDRTADELASVQEVLGPHTRMAGFYSYGEICPTAPGANCTLHNQTMTVTTLSEI